MNIMLTCLEDVPVSIADIVAMHPRIRVVVPISGGKDSQACLKLAVETVGSRAVIGLFCDTGWEHPLTYAHIRTLEDRYQVAIFKLIAGSVSQQVLRMQRFPAPRIRFCTSNLKIRPSKWFYESLVLVSGAFEVWYGMRAGESADRTVRYAGIVGAECYMPHEVNGEYPKKLGTAGVRFRLPIVDWSTSEVMDYLRGESNPLYAAGFKRVGCFPCLASAASQQNNAFNFDTFGASQKQQVITLENAIGKKHTPANTDQLCMFCQI